MVRAARRAAKHEQDRHSRKSGSAVMAPAITVPRLLRRAGLRLADIDLLEIHANLAGGSGMVIDAVEVFVLDDEARIATLSAYWDMSRARTRA